MKVDTMRAIDRWVGIPLTFLLTLIVRPFSRGARPKSQRILFIELSEMGSTILADPAMAEELEGDRAFRLRPVERLSVRGLGELAPFTVIRAGAV